MRRVRGRWLMLTKHAYDGMSQERPAITIDAIQWMFEDPDYDDGKEVRKRFGRWTIRAYYTVTPDEVEVRGVSRTTGVRF